MLSRPAQLSGAQGPQRWTCKSVAFHIPLRCKKVRNSIMARTASLSGSSLSKFPKPERDATHDLPLALWGSRPHRPQGPGTRRLGSPLHGKASP